MDNFHAYRGFMLLISALMFCAIWLMLSGRGSPRHPGGPYPSEMVGALGHMSRSFTTVFAGGSASPASPASSGELSLTDRDGVSPWGRSSRGGGFGGLGSLAGASSLR